MIEDLTLIDAITNLDKILTGKTDAEVSHTAANQHFYFEEPIRFIESFYHLSDGGYSRIRYCDDYESFHLSSVSTDAVKKKLFSQDGQIAASNAASILKRILEKIYGSSNLIDLRAP